MYTDIISDVLVTSYSDDPKLLEYRMKVASELWKKRLHVEFTYDGGLSRDQLTRICKQWGISFIVNLKPKVDEQGINGICSMLIPLSLL
jgi:histidyl-tRNA synthetase